MMGWRRPIGTPTTCQAATVQRPRAATFSNCSAKVSRPAQRAAAMASWPPGFRCKGSAPAATKAMTTSSRPNRAAMISVISAYNGFNTAPTPASFAAIGVTGVNALSSSQLASLNSLLAGMPSTARDSVAEIQAIVDAFTKLVAAADQQANSSATLTAADYAALGAGNINSTPKVTLLNNIVDALNLTQVNTQAQLQTLANAASGIIVTAAGGTASPALTAADFTAIGVTGVDPTLMPFLLIEIAKTADDGSGVATVAQIQALVVLALDAKAKATPVGPQPQAITLAAVADQILATASGSGQVSITLAPSATSALTVTLTSQTPSVCNVTGYTLNLLTAGTCVVVATQDGDAQWLAADPITISFQIFSAAAPASGVSVQTSVAKGAPLNGAIVSFTPGDLNGSSLVRYLVVATPSKGGAPVTVECAGSPCTVLGLAAGTSYVFRVDTVSLLAGVTSTTSGTPTPAILVPGKFGLLMLVSSPTVSVGSSSGIQYSSILGAPALEWSSSDASICTVDQFGNVTGIAVGSCVVTAKIVVDAAGTIPYADASATIKIVAATDGFQTLPLVPGPIVPVVVPNPLSAATSNPATAAESGISVPLPANVDGPTNLSVNLPATAGIKSVTVVVTDAAGNEVERITAPVDPVTGQVIFPMSHLAKGYKVAMFTSVPAALVKKTGNVVRGRTYFADPAGVIRGAKGTYTLVGKKIVPAVTFGAAKWALSKQTRNQLKQFAKYAVSHGGRVFVTGFVMHNAGGSVRVEKTIATARARAVGRYLAKLGVNVWINYSGFGAASTKHPKPSDRKVEIRWSQDAAPMSAKTNK
mgnify:FL=1